jgi:hypothetical protein
MDSFFVPPQKTFFTEHDLATAIQVSFKNLFGKRVPIDTLAVLWAQFALECGRGKRCYNWNIGNIKRLKNRPGAERSWTMYRCSEIIGGREIFFDPPHPQTMFCAYQSLDEAVTEHLSFLSGPRYSRALKAALSGNPEQYVLELKKAGYFTASVNLYLRAVNALYLEFIKKYSIDFESNDEFYQRIEKEED